MGDATSANGATAMSGLMNNGHRLELVLAENRRHALLRATALEWMADEIPRVGRVLLFVSVL